MKLNQKEGVNEKNDTLEGKEKMKKYEIWGKGWEKEWKEKQIEEGQWLLFLFV